jgi:hypothetical protein
MGTQAGSAAERAGQEVLLIEAVLRWSARSLMQGTPKGRFSRLPGLGI